MLIDCPPIAAFAHEAQHEARIRTLQKRHAEHFPANLSGVRRPIVVNGVRYECVLEASLATGISEKTIREGALGITHRHKERGTGILREFSARWVEEADL